MIIGDRVGAAEENGGGSGSGLRRWEPELVEFWRAGRGERRRRRNRGQKKKGHADQSTAMPGSIFRAFGPTTGRLGLCLRRQRWQATGGCCTRAGPSDCCRGRRRAEVEVGASTPAASRSPDDAKFSSTSPPKKNSLAV